VAVGLWGRELIMGCALILFVLVPVALIVQSLRPDPKMDFLLGLIAQASAGKAESEESEGPEAPLGKDSGSGPVGPSGFRTLG
jgi:hypothetical protein